MAEKEDWRLRPGDDELYTGMIFALQKFRAKYPGDHEHCDFCSGEFMDKSDQFYLNTDEHPVMEEGYEAQDKSSFICAQCFHDFRERFGWKLATDSIASTS
jgi:hypothetical protein